MSEFDRTPMHFIRTANGSVLATYFRIGGALLPGICGTIDMSFGKDDATKVAPASAQEAGEQIVESPDVCSSAVPKVLVS